MFIFSFEILKKIEIIKDAVEYISFVNILIFSDQTGHLSTFTQKSLATDTAFKTKRLLYDAIIHYFEITFCLFEKLKKKFYNINKCINNIL